MQRIIDTAGDDSAVLDLDWSLASAEAFWHMVLAMAMRDRAWCVQYDVNHPARLVYVTEWQVFGLLPPPDEMADMLVRAIDGVTRPGSLLGRILAAG